MINLYLCPICSCDSIKRYSIFSGLDECNNCNFVFANPQPSLIEISDYYSKPAAYDNWIVNLEGRKNMWRRRLKIILKYSKHSSLLDIGAGIGQFLDLAKDNFKELFGTEVSVSAINFAKNNYGLNLFKGDFNYINLHDLKFDNITLFHVLEHVHNPLELLVKARSVLSEDGTIFIAVPNDLNSIFARIHNLKNKVRSFFINNFKLVNSFISPLDLSILNREIHLSQFASGSLKNALEISGFKIVKITLDPFYPNNGFKLFLHNIFFSLCKLFYLITRINIYYTTLIIARKK